MGMAIALAIKPIRAERLGKIESNNQTCMYYCITLTIIVWLIRNNKISNALLTLVLQFLLKQCHDTTQSLTKNLGPNGRRKQKLWTISNLKLFLSSSKYKVDQKTKVVHYFDNSNGKFGCQHQIGL